MGRCQMNFAQCHEISCVFLDGFPEAKSIRMRFFKWVLWRIWCWTDKELLIEVNLSHPAPLQKTFVQKIVSKSVLTILRYWSKLFHLSWTLTGPLRTTGKKMLGLKKKMISTSLRRMSSIKLEVSCGSIESWVVLWKIKYIIYTITEENNLFI